MRLIESYKIADQGFHPVLIRDSWQVSKLNYSDDLHIDHLKCLMKHQKSDRAISLLMGMAILVVMAEPNGNEFGVVPIKRGTSYHIPKNVWYSIAMWKGSQLFIVEKPYTHCDDIKKLYLQEVQLDEIRRKVNETINTKDA